MFAWESVSKYKKKKRNIKYVAIGKRITEWECKLT